MPLYFAYGSNLHEGQMKSRCPSAHFVCRAELKDHALKFTRRSIQRGCGVVDAVPEPDESVWGVVYRLDETELGRLDTCEGFHLGRTEDQNSYNRRESHVHEDGLNERPLTVYVYFANRQEGVHLPNRNYMDLILTGARHWRLSEDYIRALESIEVSQ